MKAAIKAINKCSIPNKAYVATRITTRSYYINCEYTRQLVIADLGLLYLALNNNEEITLKIESKQIKIKKQCQD